MSDRLKGMKKLPAELKDYIYDIAGPLTKYLNGRMDLNSTFNKRLIRRDAIQIDWRGDYTVLFCISQYECPAEIADIVINQSEYFHGWLLDQLRSNNNTWNIIARLYFFNWDNWWRNSIEASTFEELRNHLDCAIGNCHFNMVRYILTNQDCKRKLLGERDDERYFLTAFVKECQEYWSSSEDVFRKSAQSKMLWSILQNVTLNGPNRAMDAAAMIGDIEIVKWVHQNIRDCCTVWALDYAAKYGHLEIVKWLHENRTEGCTTEAMDYAAYKGHLEVVKWLHENRTEGCTVNAMDGAAENGHLEVVKWLHENRTEGCTNWAMDNASRYGNLEVVKWLQDNRTEGCTIDAMDYAAMNGHLEVLKWLHENRTEGCSKSAIDDAAANGHIEVVKWLNETLS